jgi:hypothetical protein
MPRETYLVARRRILAHLVLQGWALKSSRQYHQPLKIPQATKDGETLYFHPQAVYLNAHSLFIDIRSMATADFDAAIARRLESNRREGMSNGSKCEPT